MQFSGQRPSDSLIKTAVLLFFVILVVADLMVAVVLLTRPVEEQKVVVVSPTSEPALFLPLIGNEGPPGNSVIAYPAASSPTPAPNFSTTAQTYVVKPGDTIYKISNQFGVSQEDLIKANNIKDKNLIYAGQELVIPPSTTQVPTAASTLTTETPAVVLNTMTTTPEATAPFITATPTPLPTITVTPAPGMPTPTSTLSGFD
jgi:LysM repeat protein